jgi:hypothetical protein
MKKAIERAKSKLTLTHETMKLLGGADLSLAAGGSGTPISFGHKPGQCVPDGIHSRPL